MAATTATTRKHTMLQLPVLPEVSFNLTCMENYTCRYVDYDFGNQTDYMPSESTALFYYYLWTKVVPTIFSLIILIGTVGNSLVIYVILSRRKMRTVTNFLLLNLAMSDIAFLLICVPFQTYKYVSFSWPFGDLSCKIVQYFLYITAYVTVWTLTSISATRFLTVVYASETARYRTKKNVIILCVLIWITMLVVNIPTILNHKINVVNTYSYCGIEPNYTKILFISFFVCAYAVPLTLICLLYFMIIVHLRANRGTMLTSTKHRTARACKLIIIVIVVFCVSWAPNHINSLLALYKLTPNALYYEVLRILWHCMAYGNSLANPFIYNYASEEFRKAFREIFCCKCKETEGEGKTTNNNTSSSVKKRSMYSHGSPVVNGEDRAMIKAYHKSNGTVCQTINDE